MIPAIECPRFEWSIVHYNLKLDATKDTITVHYTDILQYRLRFGFSLLYKTVFHLNSLTVQLSYEGRAEVEGAK
jgi:hypothetical protein